MEFDTETLFNIIARRQLYVEGVKTSELEKFQGVIAKIAARMRQILGSVEYDRLNEMTRAELQALINQIKKEIDDEMSAWLLVFTASLTTFAYSSYQLNQRLYGSFLAESDEILNRNRAVLILKKKRITDLNKDQVWSKISNVIMLATGVTALSFARGFVTATRSAILASVQKAVAAAKSPAEALKDLTRDNSKPGQTNAPQGVLRLVGTQAKSVFDTILQQVSESAGYLIGSRVYDRYRWDSVMDSRTTDICRNLNGQIFRIGQGPIPPAHYNCRSHITQLTGKRDDKRPPNLYDWARTQPEAFIKDILGLRDAALLAAGKMTEADLRKKLRSLPAISVDEFESKAEIIYNPSNKE